MRSARHDDGFTLIEVTIILMALVILAAILVPSIGGFNALARGVRVKGDLGALCSMMKMMLDDIGASAFFESGYAGSASYRASYGGGYAASGYGAAYDTSVTIEQSTQAVNDWCTNCDMPRSDCGPDCRDDCGPDCRDDCGPDCRRPAREPITGITTQTRHYASRAVLSAGGGYGGGGVYSASYGRGAAGGYGAAFGWPIGLLIGAGDTPASAIGATEWQLPIGATFTEFTHGRFPVSITFRVGAFDDQLVRTDPTLYGFGPRAGSYGAAGGGYGTAPYAGAGLYDRYGRTLDTRRFFRWRGPYLADGVAPDPWGNRYMANVFGLHVPAAHTVAGVGAPSGHREEFASAVVCYSAGPNEQIETVFNQAWGWITGGDDVTVVLAGAGGIR